MILPAKHISHERALLTLGARLLTFLDSPRTVSSLWDVLRSTTGANPATRINYDWFILTLDLLFATGIIVYTDGLIARAKP